jgi:ABC-type phosphate transport system, periplasmic component
MYFAWIICAAIALFELRITWEFYQWILTIGCVVLWLSLLLRIWRIMKLGLALLCSALAVAAIVSPPFVFKMNAAHLDRIEIKHDLSLFSYEPFSEGTLAVSLDEPAALSLTNNLPSLDGALALYPLYSAFAKAVYPANDDTMAPVDDGSLISCANTPMAYQKLIHGLSDIIFAAGPSAEQLQMAKDAGVELKLTPIGREAFVFFVNAKNPVAGLSTDNIKTIYSGGATNWNVFGGKDSAIRAFQRPENSGSQTALLRLMGDTPLMVPPSENIADSMGGIISKTAAYKNFSNSIGYSFLFFATEMIRDNKIKLLSVDGVAPTRKNVANGSYPHASEFYAVTAGTTNPNVDAFIAWMRGEQGQRLVEKTGYTPLQPHL